MGNTKKTKATKQRKKIKRPSFTDSEKSNESSQSVVKKKVKKRKIVLASSDEEDSAKDITIDGLFLQSYFPFQQMAHVCGSTFSFFQPPLKFFL
jgi:5'(3')-deoxyribonucleotidase